MGPLFCMSVPGFHFSVCSVLWALFVSVTQGWIFCAIVLRLLSVLPYSVYGCLKSKNNENPWKLLEISPITTFGVRESRKDAGVDGFISDLRTVNNTPCYRHKLTGLIYGPKARWA